MCSEDGYPTVLSAPFRPMTSDPLVGTIVDERYEIHGRLGHGGMGVIYKATQLTVDRTVALKFLRRDLASSLTDIARFQQEARAVGALCHPNTVRLFDFGQADAGNLYLVMECLEGESFADLIAREAPLPPVRVVHLAKQVLESLAEAHAGGIVHRDLKPENLYLAEVHGKKDFVKVLDFGVAKMAEQVGSGDSLTGTGVAVGSPRYMAPEQACAEGVTTSADLYALGGILYELLTGVPVFQHSLPMECLIAHLRESPSRPRVGGVELAGPLVDLVMRCLSKLPSERPDSAAAMLDELRGLPAEDARLAQPVAQGGAVLLASQLWNEPTHELADVGRDSTLDLVSATAAPTRDLQVLRDRALPPTVVRPSMQLPGRLGRLAALGVLAVSLMTVVWWTQRGTGGGGAVEAGALLRVAPMVGDEEEGGLDPSVLRPMAGRTIIHSVPSKARVVDEDGTVMGKTPLTVVWDPDGDAPELGLELRGFHTASLSLDGPPVLEHVVHLEKLDETPPPLPMGGP
ncbi:MAG: serine/threonine-protein kinase [Myxococcota bacterium]|nr:serine/threonine-protein kinase [Myxococcota bacterium]